MKLWIVAAPIKNKNSARYTMDNLLFLDTILLVKFVNNKSSPATKILNKNSVFSTENTEINSIETSSIPKRKSRKYLRFLAGALNSKWYLIFQRLASNNMTLDKPIVK